VRRGAFLVVCLGGFLLMAGILTAGGSPTIAEISVEGGERIGTSKLRIKSGLHIGQRWSPALRIEAIRALKSLPGIRDAEVSAERIKGGRVKVRIEVEERQPYGVVALEGRGLFWADRDGYLLGPLKTEPYLPVMAGVSVALTPQGERIAPEGALKAFREFFALEGRILSYFRELRFRGYDLELEDLRGRRVLLPAWGLKSRLKVFERVGEALGSDWQRLDLRFEGEVTVGR